MDWIRLRKMCGGDDMIRYLLFVTGIGLNAWKNALGLNRGIVNKLGCLFGMKKKNQNIKIILNTFKSSTVVAT